jgi:hypothetical protein
MKATSAQVASIEKFVKTLQKRVNEHTKANYPSLTPDKIEVEYGNKYARIVKGRSDTSRSVHCFIEVATGDIYKAATWKAPAKHVRGNINTPDRGMSAVGVYGANYLK